MDRSGELLDRYRIGTRLGAGGMGEVYRARDEQLDRDVAIKLLPAASLDDPVARARLIREARAAAALNHPNVCTIFDVGEAGGQAYIAMELVEGQTLAAALAGGALPPDQVIAYARQLADALAHAHERGVVHRDLKSPNIIITPDRRVKVLDFGLAKRASRTDPGTALTQQTALTQLGTAMGTLAYMAPEQLRGHPAQTQSDIWALGVVVCEMASGARPFTGQTEYELSAAVLSETPVALPPAIPPGLRAILERCLEKDPERRYGEGREVREALEVLEALEEEPRPSAAIRPRPGSAPPEALTPPGRVTRRRALWLGTAAVAGAASGFAGWRLLPRREALRSLAVLPFQNPAGDEELEYLCEGVAEALIDQISTLPSLRVNAFSTVLGFTTRAVDPREAGRQLGVETVLAGTLERQGMRLVIRAELMDVASGAQLWSHGYDRTLSALLNVQDEIAGAIMAEGLRLRLSSDEQRRLVRHPTEDGEAYDLYLQARHFQRRATEEDYLYARELLERAVIRDPKFARAYGALGGVYAMLVTDGLARPTDAWPQATRNMRQAFQLDPELPEAHAIAHAHAFLFDWDWAGAERERLALTRLPAGEFDPHFLRAFALERWALGRSDEAMQLARRARELDPLSPDLVMLEADYLAHAGHLDGAVALYERSIRMEPDNPNPYFGLAEARLRQGRPDEAIEARRQAHGVAGDDRLAAVLAPARGEQGYRQIQEVWVRLQLESLEARKLTHYVSPLDFARAHAQLGQAELAFQHLEAAFIDRAPGLVFLNVDRAWDRVRDDPRFQAAVRRVGLP